MDPSEFIAKWQRVELKERSAAQQHFLDLCELVGHRKPAAVDHLGDSFTFERGAAKLGGGEGWADVWKKGFFGWEYKGRDKDLDAAYTQLKLYAEALENPPLLVVSDLQRIIIRTNFTNTPTETHEISLDQIGEPRSLEILRALFLAPDKLKPGTTSQVVTEKAARQIAQVAERLRGRGALAEDVAVFLDRIVFCLFAEDVGLLPNQLFRRVVESARDDPPRLKRKLEELFSVMAEGGDYGADSILHFNGSLFTDRNALLLRIDEVEALFQATKLDWSAVDASIFGTLFERGLDPDKRSQLGAHYTSRADIETLIEPVVMAPLRRDWEETQQVVDLLLTTGRKQRTDDEVKAPTGGQLTKARSECQILPDSQVIVFSFESLWQLGLLHSRPHEVWARQLGTQLRERESGFRYTPRSCFETFPFPRLDDTQREVISAITDDLDRLRTRWLNPPEWISEDLLEFPASIDGPWATVVQNPGADGIGTARYIRLLPRDEDSEQQLKKRTLTNLYNERPAWLDQAHVRLNEAVFAAYGWSPDLSDDEVISKLLEMNLDSAGEGVAIPDPSQAAGDLEED